MKTPTRLPAAIATLGIFLQILPAMAASPPADLVETERQVSLELAHVRDSGPTDPVKRKELFDASQLEQQGEAAIKSGDYHSAETDLLHARDILRHLRDTTE
jgi:hypothetical protein